MSNQAGSLDTNATTPVGRLAYASILQKKYNTLAKRDEYCADLHFLPGTDLTKFNEAIDKACVNKWGADKAKWPKKKNHEGKFVSAIVSPIKSQSDLIDKAKEKGRDPYPHLDPAAFYIHSWTGALSKQGKPNPPPKVVDLSGARIEEESRVYNGCYARFMVKAKAYENGSNYGVTLYLIAVQFMKDGERFSSTPSVEEGFAAIPEEYADAASMFSNVGDMA